MRAKVVVSVVQMKVLSAEKNLSKILNYIKKASQLKSDIVCFPECSFNPDEDKPSCEKDLGLVQKECQKRNIFLILNGYFRGKNKKDVYNRTYFIDNKGKILDFYNKIYLWTDEIGKIKRGKEVKVFNTPLGKIGLCICWDLFFPEIFRKLKNKGAEIIFCLSYWSDNLKKESKFLEYAPTVLAYQYMLFFIYCNALFKGKTSISQIAAPWGDLAKIKRKEGMITTAVYPNRLKQFKEHFKKAFWERSL